MPYKNAPYFVVVVIAVIAAGFWPTYWSVVGTVPWQFHAHGAAASLWVMMVLAQSVTAHDKAQLPLHRAVGKASLFLFPFLTGGLMAIIDVTAKGYVAGNDPFRVMYGGSLMIGMAVAIAAYVALFYRALRYRRKVWTHAGYMLATPLILFESPFSRLLQRFVPYFSVAGPADFPKVMAAILWSMAVELVVIAAIWAVHRDKARPFLVAGEFVVAQMVAMGLMGGLPLIKALLTVVGHAPSTLVVLGGFAIGAATSWAGWHSTKRPAIRRAAEPA